MGKKTVRKGHKRLLKGDKDKLDFPRGDKNPVHIKVYVPSTKERDIEISKKELKMRVNETVKKLNQLFGGTTRVKGIGSWNAGKNQTINENVVLVESFAKRADYLENDVKLEDWIYKKVKDWGQDQISFEYEEDLYFIET